MRYTRDQVAAGVRLAYAEVGLNLDAFAETNDLTLSGKIPEILHHAIRFLSLSIPPPTPGAAVADTVPIQTVADIIDLLYQASRPSTRTVRAHQWCLVRVPRWYTLAAGLGGLLAGLLLRSLW